MWVYRIQNKDGHGPYTAFLDSNSPPWATKEHSAETGCPPPTRDGFKPSELKQFSWRFDIRFGFKDLKQLNNWFNKKELENLNKLGYNIYKIRASKVFKGKKQVVFVRAGDKKDDIRFD